MEKRHSFFKSQFNTRESDDGKKYITGYFALFDQETELWEGMFEKIAHGAFDDTIANDDIRCLFNHNTDIVLGRNKNSTLVLRADEKGLYGEVEINQEDSEAVNAYARVKRGDVTGCSFGFDSTAEERIERDNGVLYIVKTAKLYEVSPCTFPAYPQTEIQARKKVFEADSKKAFSERKSAIKKKLEEIKNVKTA